MTGSHRGEMVGSKVKRGIDKQEKRTLLHDCPHYVGRVTRKKGT